MRAGGLRGHDAAKKIKGRKRHVLVHTNGRGLVLEPHPADIRNRDGRDLVIAASRHTFPKIQKLFAVGSYAGERAAQAAAVAIEIVHRNPG